MRRDRGSFSRARPQWVLIAWALAGAVVLPCFAATQAPDLVRVNEALRRLDAVDVDGNEWGFEQLEGRVVLIDFWATWCAPCLAEVPYLRTVVQRYPDELIVLGVSLDRVSRREVVSWLSRQRVGWPQVHDGRGFVGELARAFDVEELPTSVLIDHRGRVRALTPRGDDLLAAVDALVAEMSTARGR